MFKRDDDRIRARIRRGNPSGVLTRRYKPHQWKHCDLLLQRGISVTGAAMLSGLSYYMAWKISKGMFKYGVMPRKEP